MNRDYRVQSDYFLYGIEFGIIPYDEAIKWANSIIEDEDEPTGEIVDLALSGPWGKNGVVGSLKSIQGVRNLSESGHMLFELLEQMLESGADLQSIATLALSISWLTHPEDDLRFEFDRIEDEIGLAEQGIYGDLMQCKKDLIAALCQHRRFKT